MGWLAYRRLTGEPEQVGNRPLPWPPTRSYQYTMPIEVIAEPDVPPPFSGTEAAQQAGFGSTAALGQSTEVKPVELTGLKALFSPLSHVESAVATFLRAIGVQLSPELDARDCANRLIAVGRGKQAFRSRLPAAFGNSSCISGSTVEATREVAPVTPYEGVHSNERGNGLLVRSDLHTIFDTHLLT